MVMLRIVLVIGAIIFSLAVSAAQPAADSVFNPLNYEVVVLDSINSPESDWLPALYPDGNTLYFVSNRTGSTLLRGIGASGNTRSFDWWMAQRMPNSTFGRPEIWQQVVTPLHEGAGCFSLDAEQFYYTICDAPKGFGSCDIYVMKRDSTGALVAQNLGANINTEFWESQPTLTPDGRLYFVSNRPSGRDKNIWYADYDWATGTFGKAVSAGRIINTSGDENAPYYSQFDDALYFSSNGLTPNVGNADIYRTKLLPNGDFEVPQLIGEPFSSDSEDLGVIFSADGNEAFITSKRTKPRSQGGFDIFLLRKKKR